MQLPIKQAQIYLSEYNIESSEEIIHVFEKAYKDFRKNTISVRLFSAIAESLRVNLQNKDITVKNQNLLSAIESASGMAY